MAQREQFMASCNQQASVAMVTSGRTTPRGGNLGIEGALSICPSLSMFLTIHLCPCVWLSMCLIVHVSIYVHICLSIVCLSICLPVDLSSWLLTCSVHFLHSPFPLQMHTQGGNSTTGNWRCIIFLSISVHVFGCPCVHLCPYCVSIVCLSICLPVGLSSWLLPCAVCGHAEGWRQEGNHCQLTGHGESKRNVGTVPRVPLWQVSITKQEPVCDSHMTVTLQSLW